MIFGIINLTEAGYSVKFEPTPNRHGFTMAVSRDGMETSGVIDSWVHGCIEQLIEQGQVQVTVDAGDMLLALCRYSVKLCKRGDLYVAEWQEGESTQAGEYLAMLVAACCRANEMKPMANAYLPQLSHSAGVVQQALDKGYEFELANHPDPCSGGYQVKVYKGELIGAEKGMRTWR